MYVCGTARGPTTHGALGQMDEPEQPSRPQYAAALIERFDNRILIAKLAAADEEERVQRRWVFPRGLVLEGESPEAAMRRIARTQLGVKVEIVVGQPPILASIDADEVEVRYFFCGIISGEPKPGPYAEVHFTTRKHLAEYDFDPAAAPVADWLRVNR